MGDGGTDRKGKRIPKLSFPSFLNPAPGELLRPFSFSGVSGKLPSPSTSALIQFPMLEPLGRIPPPETGREPFPRPWAAVFLALGAVRPHRHFSLPFLCAYPLSQQKAIFGGGAFHRHMTAEGGQARTTSILAHDDATAQRCSLLGGAISCPG